jgi:ABC-type molybdate transport system permease subunit
MIRVVIENVVLFFLPMAIYVTYVLLTRKAGTKTGLLDDAPLMWLMFAGTVVVFVVLIAFGSSSGGKPGQVYIPPSLTKDGRVEPGVLK